MELRADCARCVGLCCVALPFAASRDFGFDKAAGEPCRHLDAEHRCGIHDRLRDTGFRGCASFDCFGAGQRVTQVVYDGRGWRENPDRAREMFAVFEVVRGLHELLWYLDEAVCLPVVPPLRAELEAVRQRIDALTRSAPAPILDADVADARAEVGTLLRRASAQTRGARHPGGAELGGADLAGRRPPGDLRGAYLRGALLIAADLSSSDLRSADLLGADLRDADLSGADLDGCLFLTQPQLDAAEGDSATVLPDRLRRPGHWAV
ncbi:MAG: pentapeptide repeat-containing protein [Actinomycetota bacterium]